MKGLFGFVFALLLLAVIGLFYQHNRYQEIQLQFQEQLKAARQEAYYRCKEEANEQLKEELEYAKRTAWENGYNSAVSEYRKKMERSYQDGYEKGQADKELACSRRVFQMEQAHQEEIQQLKAEHQKRVMDYQNMIRHLELEKKHSASKRAGIQSTLRKEKVSFSRKSQKSALKGKVSQEQRRLNVGVILAICMLPFLAAMIQGLLQRKARRWKL